MVSREIVQLTNAATDNYSLFGEYDYPEYSILKISFVIFCVFSSNVKNQTKRASYRKRFS